jgi:hypothetical protein
MARSLDKVTLMKELSLLQKDWYTIYQWPQTSACRYTEWLAEWLVDSFANIRLVTDGLRQMRSFRVEDHGGDIRLKTGIKQFTEKRFLRAMFNRLQVPPLGRVKDYEIPLKETQSAKHGDIDLLCVLGPLALCIEAKQPRSSESILKAILQAFAYTSLIASRRATFLSDFDLPATLQLTPAVLTFSNATSGSQLKKMRDCPRSYPTLLKLLRTLNSNLAASEIAPIRFYMVENTDTTLKTCLTTTEHPPGKRKAIFRNGFTLNIVEYVLH